MAQFIYIDPSPVPPTLSGGYRDTYISTTTGLTHTVTLCDIGSADSTRVVVVGISATQGSTTSTTTLSSATVAGLTGTVAIQSAGAKSIAGQFYCAVPTGTTATITATFTHSHTACAFHVYALYDLSSSSPHATASLTNLSGSSSTTIAVPAGGMCIGAGDNDSGSVTCTTSGVMEDDHADYTASGFTDNYCTASATSVLGETMTVYMRASSLVRCQNAFTSWR
jgi:hypothetical protein